MSKHTHFYLKTHFHYTSNNCLLKLALLFHRIPLIYLYKESWYFHFQNVLEGHFHNQHPNLCKKRIRSIYKDNCILDPSFSSLQDMNSNLHNPNLLLMEHLALSYTFSILANNFYYMMQVHIASSKLKKIQNVIHL
jgi:hypothetical protein